MSYVTPIDIGAKYRFLAHSMREYIGKAIEGKDLPANLPRSTQIFFEQSVRGSIGKGTAVDTAHFKLARDALGVSGEAAISQLEVLAKANGSFLAGKATPTQLTNLQTFFDSLFQLSDRNATAYSLAGKSSSYTY